MSARVELAQLREDVGPCRRRPRSARGARVGHVRSPSRGPPSSASSPLDLKNVRRTARRACSAMRASSARGVELRRPRASRPPRRHRASPPVLDLVDTPRVSSDDVEHGAGRVERRRRRRRSPPRRGPAARGAPPAGSRAPPTRGRGPSRTCRRASTRSFGDLDDAAVLDHRRPARHAHLARERGVAREVVDRPVDRDEAPRAHELDHPSLLGAMRVPAHVHAAIGARA